MGETDRVRERVIEYPMGVTRDPDDERDYVLTAARPTKLATVSYRHPVPRRDQGDEGTCAAFGSAFVKQRQDWVQGREYHLYAPRHLYQEAKQIDGLAEEGTYPRVVMKVLKDVGVCLEEQWPYEPRVVTQPVAGYRRLARPQKTKGYARLRTPSDVLQYLVNARGSCVAGLLITDGWYGDVAVETGRVDESSTNEVGGHLVEVLGWDDERRLVEIGNSWGPDYGDDGHNWVGLDWFADHLLDSWAMYDDTKIDKNLVVLKP